jgi:hypothetical protein
VIPTHATFLGKGELILVFHSFPLHFMRPDRPNWRVVAPLARSCNNRFIRDSA